MKRIKSYNRFVESMEFEEGHESEELGGEGEVKCADCGEYFELPRNKADEISVEDEKGGFICPECAEPYTGGAEGEGDEDY